MDIDFWMRSLEPLIKTAESNYTWKIPRNCPISFERQERPLLDNLRLRQSLHEIWRKDRARRVQIAKWYVSEWGGIRTNRDGRVAEFVEKMPHVPRRLAGVSTWSKIATLSDPHRFAIYDSRVAFSLNALQHLECGAIKEPFPIPPGRNAAIGSAVAQFKVDGLRRSGTRDFYSRYMTIVTSTEDPQRAEMALFAAAEIMAERCLGRSAR